MTSHRKDLIHKLLKGIETGDPEAVNVINPDKYIQHNPQTHVERDGLAALFKELAKTSPRVNLVRIFEDGDYIFAHTEYDFARSNIGFEIFRFEGEQTTEHWDNIQERKGPNASGHTMVDGATEVTDRHLTEANRKLVEVFVDDILINRHLDKIENYIAGDQYTEHNPASADGLSAFHTAIQATSNQIVSMQYDKLHRVLAEGNFVLSVSEGSLDGVHTAFYDLFRIADGKLVEHWDTVEAVAPKSEWKNDNGKF